jgi:hypothetical protein
VATCTQSISRQAVAERNCTQGRISFIDWLSDSDNVTSVTGFVLNGGIQQ